MTDPTAWLDERQRLADDATEGPWQVGDSDLADLSWVAHLNTNGQWDDRTTVCSAEAGSHPDQEHLDARFIADARTSVPEMVAALRAVLELHRPSRNPFDGPDEPITCNTCGRFYPCPTRLALTDALNTEKEN